MSREDVIRRIVERDILKLDLSEVAVRVEMPDLYQDACDFFGTWDTALQYSGISGRRATKVRPKRISSRLIGADVSPAAVVKMIQKLCTSGYRLSEKKVMCRDRRLYDAALEHFGTWNQALTESGVNPDNIRMEWNNEMSPGEQLVGELLKRHRLGESLLLGDVSRENLGLAEAVRSVFGGWTRGLLAAGLIEPSQLGRCKCLDRQQVIDAISERCKTGQSLLTRVVQKEHGILLHSARMHFSSWQNAIEFALRAQSSKKNTELGSS